MRTEPRFWLTMGTHTLLAVGVYLLGKPATVEFPVLTLGILRFTIAALGFALLVRLRGYDLRTPFRRSRSSFLLGGFLGVFMNQVVFLWGLKLTLPAHAALLYALTPTVVLLIGWIRGVERPSLRKGVGIALAFLGVLVLFSGRHSTVLPTHWMLGDFLILLAMLSWAGYTVISSTLVRQYGSELTTALTIFVGFALFLPVGLLGFFQFHPAQISSAGWIGAAYLGLVGSILMYLLWFHALGMKEPSRVAMVTNGQPILTALAGWALFGHAITPAFGLGALLVVVGVVISQW
jgi:drug/metabolite transporter (DMT)-like permease